MASSIAITSKIPPIHNTLLPPAQKQNPAAKPPSLPPQIQRHKTAKPTKRLSFTASPVPISAPVEPSSLPAAIFNAMDNFINVFIDPPQKPAMDPKCVLAGNFAPVDELPPTECTVVDGVLPPSLDGAYIRNGPNPQFLPRGPYHLFDGDGMLHSIRISKGKATFCSRYVKTYKYEVEKERGHPVFPSVFSGFANLSGLAARGSLSFARIIAGEFNLDKGFGVANTSLALIAGGLYALGESDLPYAVKIDDDGEIHTIGRHDFDGSLFMSMTAHPKTDPETGETFAFRYGPMPPFLTLFRINSDGKKQPDLPIYSFKDPSFLHDFAITKKYAIFNENQIVMNPLGIVNGGSMVAASTKKVSRLGIIPRYAKNEADIRWIDVPGLNFIHFTNAWDEDDGETVVIVAPNILSIENALEKMELVHASMEMVKIDLRSDTVVRWPLSAMNLDFPVINPAFVGRKNRYVFSAVGYPMPKISGVVKLDISMYANGGRDCVVGSRDFGLGCFAGEPIFVPRQSDGAEDDGYLVVYVHDENIGESKFLVMDATSPELDIVASVRLPSRVPYGFHSLFVHEHDLEKL